jgi:hypothetical protein
MADSPAPKIAVSGANTIAASDMTKVDSTHYTFTYTVGTGDGAATVALSTGKDLAGNVVTSAPTSGATFTVDNTASAAPVITTASSTSSNTKPTIAGTAEPGSTVKVFDGATLLGTVVADGTGAWSFTQSSSLGDGAHTITATATDAAGNTSTASTSITITVDTTAPTAAITYSKNLVKSGDSPIITATFSETMADSPAPKIAVSGANTVAASDMTKVDSTHYTFTYTVGTGDGAATVALSTGTDLAGNVITSASGATFTVDNIVPDVKVPSTITKDATDPSGATVNYSPPSATDINGIAGLVSCTPQSGSTFKIGSSPVTCIAVDNAGNIGAATFSVIVNNPVLAPTIVSFAASAPLGSTGYGNGDTLTVKFSTGTNQPAASTKANLDSLFTFSQNLGNGYSGAWVDASTLVITINDASGATPPSIGVLTAKVTGNLKTADGTSPTSASLSPPLTGSFTAIIGPYITELVALDPHGSTPLYGNGDIITVKFSTGTNQPGVATKANLDSLFTFSQNLGNSYSGTWVNPATLVITINDATGATPPAVGVLTATVNAAAHLKTADGTSLDSTSTSPALTGSFTGKTGPYITDLVANDPTGINGGYAAGDTLTVTFSETTNQPAVATTGDLNTLFAFSQNLGAGYSGTWVNPSTLVITINDASSATPPTIGGLTLTVNAAGHLKNSGGNSLDSTSTSPPVRGSFATPSGPSIIDITGAGSGGYASGSTITVRFSDSTNQPAAATKDNLNSLFTFSQNLGNGYSGTWVNPSTLVITINDASGATPPAVGVLTAQVTGNLKNAAGNSLASTSIASPALAGNFGSPPAPFITGFTADDPTGSNAVYTNGITLTVTFSADTNRPAVALKTDIDSIFSFSQNGSPAILGKNYGGVWLTPSTLVITIKDATNATPPALGLLTVQVTGNLKNAAGTSPSSTSTSSPLSGTFGNKSGPFITSLFASDPTGIIGGYANGNTITAIFSEPTNQPAVATTGDLNTLFTFSQNLGNGYSGTWVNPSTLVITINDASGATPPAVGGLTLTINAAGHLRNAPNTSLASVSTSPILTGSFGDHQGPYVASLIANDPGNSGGGYSSGDTITLVFSESTNQPAASTKANLDSLLAFSQNNSPASLGAGYSGTWVNPSTLVITINDASGATPPAVGELTAQVTGNLKNAANTSLVSTATSPLLSGSFGQFVTTVTTGDGGTATTTLPNGIIPILTLPSGVSGSVDIGTASADTAQGASFSLSGYAVNITPSDGATCQAGCTLEFEFTQDQADALGILPADMKITHDLNEDGVFDPATESIPLSVTEIYPGFFDAKATVTFNSKFAIGGFIPALAILGATGGHHGGDSLGHPLYISTSLSTSTSSSDISTGIGGILVTSNSPTNIVATGTPFQFKVELSAYNGPKTIQHVALYTNLNGKDSEIKNSDTYIVYEPGKPLQISNQEGLLSTANVVTSEDGNYLHVTFDMTFAKPMAKSDIILRSWDQSLGQSDDKLQNALEVKDATMLNQFSEIKIPSWIKNNAKWWSAGQISESEFMQGIQYLIQQGIIIVPHTQSDSSSSQQMPDWAIKTRAGWWANDEISDQDFVSGLQYLITQGFIKINN